MKEAQGKGREDWNCEDAGRRSRFVKGKGLAPIIASENRRYEWNCARQVDSRPEPDEKCYSDNRCVCVGISEAEDSDA